MKRDKISKKVAKIQNLGFYKFFPLFEYCNSKIHVNWSMHFYKSYQICKVKIAHLIFIWKIPYTWQKTLTLKCQGIAFYYMLNKSLLTSPIYGHRYSTLFHQGPSLQGRVLDSTLNDSYSSFHFFSKKTKRKITMNERGKIAIYDIVIYCPPYTSILLH